MKPHRTNSLSLTVTALLLSLLLIAIVIFTANTSSSWVYAGF